MAKQSKETKFTKRQMESISKKFGVEPEHILSMEIKISRNKTEKQCHCGGGIYSKDCCPKT